MKKPWRSSVAVPTGSNAVLGTVFLLRGGFFKLSGYNKTGNTDLRVVEHDRNPSTLETEGTRNTSSGSAWAT